ncbi:MAG TPA: cell wall hydrolase, partial [Xanthobacteraceae bacterium]|nr:cell wall hydrolase [Xanthobacteraceae bacterium]
MICNAKPKGLFSAPFGLCIFVFALAPNQIGHQDVAALIARQPVVTAHWRQHVRASAFGTVHAATFSFSRPIGTAVPQPLSYRLASLDPRMITLGPWNLRPGLDDPPLPFPTVDRSAKGDRQPVLHPQQREPETEKIPEEAPAVAAIPSEPVVAPAEAEPVESVAADTATDENAQPSAATPEDEPGAAVEAEAIPEASEAAENAGEDIPDPVDAVVAEADDFTSTEPMVEMARLYFGNEPLGDTPGAIEKWAPGEEPTIITPAAPADPDIKQSALDPKPAPPEAKGGESIAPKGEVTGEGKRPITPAERLKLEGKARIKAEKCLADAVYFEARGEAIRGQIAVAQVVMNRVFSGFYPRSVCGAVYQNAHRRLACQFTFACDGIPDTVTEPHAWSRATRIARDVLDGKYWLPEVNRATHYHAYWVRPSWVREMKRLYKFGVHTFYRPRKWGDGEE